MDPTLSQILSALYEAHREIDRLRAELQQRDALKTEAKNGKEKVLDATHQAVG